MSEREDRFTWENGDIVLEWPSDRIIEEFKKQQTEPGDYDRQAQINEDEYIASLFIGSHTPVIVDSVCPLCGFVKAESYDGHGPLLRCASPKCKKTYDPTVEGVGYVMTHADKGPGRGWWGPDKGGTHGGGGSDGGVASGFDSFSEDIVKYAMRQVPPEHLEGIESIIPEMHPEHIEQTGTNDWRKTNIAGAYDSRTRTIHLSPHGLNADTVIHEIGHHAADKLGVVTQKQFYSKAKSWLPRTNEALAKYGLREYSMTNYREFFAEVYAVRYAGFPKQWSQLESLLRDSGTDPSIITGE